jgi:hypothetical protein
MSATADDRAPSAPGRPATHSPVELVVTDLAGDPISGLDPATVRHLVVERGEATTAQGQVGTRVLATDADGPRQVVVFAPGYDAATVAFVGSERLIRVPLTKTTRHGQIEIVVPPDDLERIAIRVGWHWMSASGRPTLLADASPTPQLAFNVPTPSGCVAGVTFTWTGRGMFVPRVATLEPDATISARVSPWRRVTLESSLGDGDILTTLVGVQPVVSSWAPASLEEADAMIYTWGRSRPGFRILGPSTVLDEMPPCALQLLALSGDRPCVVDIPASGEDSRVTFRLGTRPFRPSWGTRLPPGSVVASGHLGFGAIRFLQLAPEMLRESLLCDAAQLGRADRPPKLAVADHVTVLDPNLGIGWASWSDQAVGEITWCPGEIHVELERPSAEGVLVTATLWEGWKGSGRVSATRAGEPVSVDLSSGKTGRYRGLPASTYFVAVRAVRDGSPIAGATRVVEVREGSPPENVRFRAAEMIAFPKRP